MPWSLDKRDGKWCVIKDSDGSVSGCHDSRTDAIKQQRALYANESRMASMYQELDEVVEEIVEEQAAHPLEEATKGSELVKIVVGNEQDRALTAAVVAALEDSNGRLEQTERMVHALAAALEQRSEPPVVHVASPDVHVPPAQVTVEAPQINYQPPDIIVPPANITVNPEIVLPENLESRKKVTFVRDAFGKLEGAEITEE